jgi:hypothetical protein
VSAAGDVNGDGLDDVIIGVPGIGAVIGKAYVVFGKASTTAVQLADVTAGTGGFRIDGLSNQDRVGFFVSAAGDLNGDGLADVMIGADYANNPTADEGETYIVFGKAGTGAVSLLDIRNGTGGFSISGAASNDRAAWNPSPAGDFNGDGYDDLVIGGRNVGGLLYAGRTYIVLGSASPSSISLSSLGASTGMTITGQASSDISGHNVAGAGDVNGDGLADILIGAHAADPGGRGNAGKVYVVFGRPTMAALNLATVDAGTGGFAIYGEVAFDQLGLGLMGAGDVNGDGLGDVIVGSYANNANGSLAGRAYVVFGKANGTAVELTDVTAGTGGFTLNSQSTDQFLGMAVSAAGDVNADGLADIIAGAPFAASSNGRAYVVFSPETAPASAVYTQTARPGNETLEGIAGLNGRQYPPDSRAWIGFTGGTASTQTVTLTRNKTAISGIDPLTVAGVYWRVETTRTGFSGAALKFKYLDSEIAGLNEGSLQLLSSSATSGPWTPVTATFDAAQNEVSASVTGFSYFILADPTSHVGEWSLLQDE